ncbi:PRTRC system protein E [Bacteroides sp. AF34-31BH]|uniref:PRTRC system protein E n=1 Tax=Bacteroides sp. AF34-31BH TaxID=2292931 RepID=UPI000E70A3DF|nr:PRTRC system protein E [Bacteroides sp. AF34-31BH]RJV08722.1 PRTRC system protein E [Bacteroides sp. AF34-31BH]
MFFSTIHQMMTDGVDLTLVIRKANGQLTVSTLPKSNGLKDEAQNHIVPLTVSGQPQELDAGFLQAIARPIQKAAGLLTNMAQFEAQAEKAASESKAAKEVKAKETKEEKEKREKYEKHFKKAEELITAKKHSEAVTALGQARLYAKPQDQKKIDEMVAEQKKAMNAGSLFELMEESAPQSQAQPQQPQVQQAPQYPPQPQMQRPVSAQPQNGQRNPQQQQQTMWPPQQPAQRPVQRQVPTQPQYGAQPQMPPQQPQPVYGEQYGAHWQEQACRQEDMYPPYGQNEPAYRPEDYEEYPDFPQSMLEHHTSHYAQTV